MIELLVQFQASIEIKDSNGQTSLDLIDDQKMVKELIKNHETIDPPKNKAKTNKDGAPLAVFENKLFNKLVNALKNELEYGKLR